jgi:hypothetical protein
MLDGLGGRVTAKLGFQIFRHICRKKMHCERKAWSITAGAASKKEEICLPGEKSRGKQTDKKRPERTLVGTAKLLSNETLIA